MTVLGTILRVIWVPIAFIVSAFVSLVVLATLGLERLTHYVHGAGFTGDPLPALLDIVFRAGVLMTGLTVVPALIVVLIGEIARLRSFLYYVAGGGFALTAMPLLAQAGASLELPSPALWQVFATAGFCGGLVYWLLAGRRA